MFRKQILKVLMRQIGNPILSSPYNYIIIIKKKSSFRSPINYYILLLKNLEKYCLCNHFNTLVQKNNHLIQLLGQLFLWYFYCALIILLNFSFFIIFVSKNENKGCRNFFLKMIVQISLFKKLIYPFNFSNFKIII